MNPPIQDTITRLQSTHQLPARRHGSRCGLLLGALLWTQSAAPAVAQAGPPPLVPWPQNYQATPGACLIAPGKRIVYATAELAPLAGILAQEIRKVTGVSLTAAQGKPAANEIALSVDGKLARESYVLTANAAGVAVTGRDYNAVAMGTVTLLQCLGGNNQGAIIVPACTVKDGCAAQYNAFMLDIARQSHSLEVLRQAVDFCRFYKIRYFRLHLSDDQFFAFPFEAYPQVAAGNADRVWKLQEIKDLVRYADERAVTLVPELETPGHSSFLRGKMPEVFGASRLGVMDITNPKLYETLDVMVREMCAVFKSTPYFHIGCDEAGVGALEKEPGYAEFLAKHNLKGGSELFSYHVAKMNEIVKKYGKQTMAWEIPLNDLTPKDVIVTVWNINFNHGETDTNIKHGNQVVQVTWTPSIGWPVQAMYDWCPYGKQHKYAVDGPMIGSELVLWEQPGSAALPMMRYRCPARSEVTYNPTANKSYADFVSRLARADARYELLRSGMSVQSGKGVQTVEAWLQAGGAGTAPTYDYPGSLEARITTPLKDAAIRYTLDGSEPVATSALYTPETLKAVGQEVGSTVNFKARLFAPGGEALANSLVREFHNKPFTVKVVGAARAGDPRFGDALAFDVTQHIQTGMVRYQINGSVNPLSPRFTKSIRIADDATVMFQYFNEAGEAKGTPWRLLARKADFDPYSLTYHKEVTAAFGPKEFGELTVDGLADKNECLNTQDVTQAVTVDLGQAAELNRVILYTMWDDRRAYQYALALSADNTTWHTIADASNNTVTATPKGYNHEFAPQKARYIRATVTGNNVTKGVEITELRAYGPGQKPLAEGGTRPASQALMSPQLLANLQFIDRAEPASLKPAELSGPYSNVDETFGPRANCKLVGDVDFDWLCGKYSATIDLNGHAINWTTGGGNSADLRGTFTGSGGRINWDGGFSGGWVTYPSYLSGTAPNTFSGVFHLRHGTMVFRKPAGVSAHSGDIETGGPDGLNEAFLHWENSNQLADTSSITTLPPAATAPSKRASLMVQGFTETLGTLTVKTETLIHLGEKKDKPGALWFADSSKQAWDPAQTLTIKGEGTVRFGTTAAGLTPAQLASVSLETPQGRVKAKITADGNLAPQ